MKAQEYFDTVELDANEVDRMSRDDFVVFFAKKFYQHNLSEIKEQKIRKIAERIAETYSTGLYGDYRKAAYLGIKAILEALKEES